MPPRRPPTKFDRLAALLAAAGFTVADLLAAQTGAAFDRGPDARSRPPLSVPSSIIFEQRFQPEPPKDGAQVDKSNPKWIQVCEAGTFDGYGGGQSFVIDDKVFAAMVKNFRAHPWYVAGVPQMDKAEAVSLAAAGRLGVIPFDVDHQRGPAEAWALDLEARPTEGGALGLWAFVYFLEPAYSWMCEGRYRSTSIRWEENATHPKTNEKIGPYVIDIAFTNDPFVQGMTPIQAQRALSRAGEPPPAPHAWGACWDPWKPPMTATDVLIELRNLLDVGELATLEEVLQKVARLRSWALGDLPAPPGVDVPKLVGQVRLLLNLPVLANPATIFAELETLLGLVADEQEKLMPPAPAPVPAEPSPLVRRFYARLQALYALPALARLRPPTPIAEDEPSVTIELERMLTAGTDALAMIAALSEALKITDPKQLAATVAELAGMKARLDELLPQAQQMEQAEEASEEQLAQGDVAGVMAARSYGAELASALLLDRKGQSADYYKSQPLPERRKLRAAAREAFLKKYNVQAYNVPTHLQHLYGGTLFTGPNAAFSLGGGGAAPSTLLGGGAPAAPQLVPFGAPFGGAPVGGGAPPAPPGAPPPGAPPPPAPGALSWDEVRSATGANDAERTFAIVRKREPHLSYEAAWMRANDLYLDLVNRQPPKA